MNPILSEHLIYHMTHIDNLPSIARHGLLAHDNPYRKVDISNPEVNGRRKRREHIYGRSLHTYVPFYFNPRNAMMYQRREEKIVVLAFSATVLGREGTIFTDRNAAAADVRFFKDPKELRHLDWKRIYANSWYDDDNLKKTMMAEVLVYEHMPLRYLRAVYCKHIEAREVAARIFPKIRVSVDTHLFFGVHYDGKKLDNDTLIDTYFAKEGAVQW
jgi:hypothetical protein